MRRFHLEERRSLDEAHRQRSYRIRFEWGLAGADAVAMGADIAMVVDVLSFTTTLSVALDAGTAVLPYLWNDDSAVAYALAHDAVLAVSRNEARPGDVSLSAQTIRDAPPISRLVLPSPNGSTISYHLASAASIVLGASLRNAEAVAEWISANHDPETTSVAVIAAGELWPDGALRPAIEDLWGAGAVLHGLYERGWTGLSPEASIARLGHDAVASDIANHLRACASGRELIDHGFPGDVEIAAEIDQSRSVPILHGNRFVGA
jgi:2-phosphosulfolactate phosphatase